MPTNEENLTDEQAKKLEFNDDMWNRWGERDAAIEANKQPVSPEVQALWDIFQEEIRKELDTELIESLKNVVKFTPEDVLALAKKEFGENAVTVTPKTYEDVKVWGDDSDLKFEILTEKYRYSIVIRKGNYKTLDKGYLGCIATCRYPYPGETHLRGNDLADGKFTCETWNQIVEDIHEYESH